MFYKVSKSWSSGKGGPQALLAVGKGGPQVERHCFDERKAFSSQFKAAFESYKNW